MSAQRQRAPSLLATILIAMLGVFSQPAAADTVLITGANSGIGLEFVKQYAAKGWNVIATHRRSGVPESLATVIKEHKNVRVERLDVTSPDDLKALTAKLAGEPIDLLINNAGVYNDRSKCHDDDCPGDWGTQSFGDLHYDLLDTIMAVNVKGPLMVSEALLPNVKASKRKTIIAISSTNGSLTDQLAGSGAIFYRASKAALNRAFQLVARQEQKEGVTVVMLHPGAVVTERQAYLEGFKGMIEMPFSVSQMIATIDKLTIADTGKFLNYDGTTAPW
ncbi:MAG TPA: SDR family oxidoreductase [Gammaproteobacteria bacterium]|nr:SDR family oxidoreductase [Gammaproteobacteria bacterium]